MDCLDCVYFKARSKNIYYKAMNVYGNDLVMEVFTLNKGFEKRKRFTFKNYKERRKELYERLHQITKQEYDEADKKRNDLNSNYIAYLKGKIGKIVHTIINGKEGFMLIKNIYPIGSKANLYFVGNFIDYGFFTYENVKIEYEKILHAKDCTELLDEDIIEMLKGVENNDS